jgi:hypothetical protein
MNLKFQQVDWEKDLMYVEFEVDGQRFRWYPKWKEVDDILHCAWLTEGAFNRNRWKNYFEAICMELLLKDLVGRIASKTDFTDFPTIEVELTGIFRHLREAATGEVHYATT